MKVPVTRYYGSKRKLLDKIWEALQQYGLEFDSVLDVFGGTGIVSYYMAKRGKQVIYNDILSFNCELAKALMKTPKGTFQISDAMNLLREQEGRTYKHIVSDNYKGIYYTDSENEIIDTVIQNISSLDDNKKSSAYYVLFQSCMIKRPFNLFHRRNLNLRTNFTGANFGNKVTWEQPFDKLFQKFTEELNEFQFTELPDIEISNSSALNCNVHADLVYIDTPYFSNKKSSTITYHSRYHFLEGLMHYDDIPQYIDQDKVNREIRIGKNSEFENRNNYLEELDSLLEFHQDSIIALSYTTEGYPSIEELSALINRHKRIVHICHLGKHGFALNKNNENRQEVLIIGVD